MGTRQNSAFAGLHKIGRKTARVWHLAGSPGRRSIGAIWPRAGWYWQYEMAGRAVGPFSSSRRAYNDACATAAGKPLLGSARRAA